MIDTIYGKITENVFERCKKIRLLICDVDGVLSNGYIIMGNQGEELKTFHVRDGYGICSLLNANIPVALITGRTSKIVEDRAKTLGITHLYQGQHNKTNAYMELIDKLNLKHENVAYIGDDLIDAPVMKLVGLAAAVNDAHPLLLSQALYITQKKGGEGAVREICDLILLAQNKLTQTKGLSI